MVIMIIKEINTWVSFVIQVLIGNPPIPNTPIRVSISALEPINPPGIMRGSHRLTRMYGRIGHLADTFVRYRWIISKILGVNE